MVGVAGRWSSRVRGGGSDDMGRWSWVDLKGKGNKMIRVVSAYRVSQVQAETAGPHTACQQQYKALVRKKNKIVSPRQAFMADFEHSLRLWSQVEGHELIIMMDANEDLREKKDLRTFCEALNLVDAVEMLSPDLVGDQTYLWGRKRLDYIFLSHGVAGAAVKAGHHHFHQYVVSDHKGVYAHFVAQDLFDTD